MNTQNILQNEPYQHYSKHSSFAGYTTSVGERPIETPDNSRFIKNDKEKAQAFALKYAFEQTMKARYGEKWKQLMKADLQTIRI